MEPIDRYVAALAAAAVLYASLLSDTPPNEPDEDWLSVVASVRREGANALAEFASPPARLAGSAPAEVAHATFEAAVVETETGLLRLGDEAYLSDLPDAAKRIIEGQLTSIEEALQRLRVDPSEVVDRFVGEDDTSDHGATAEEVDAFPVWFATNREPIDSNRPALGLSSTRSDTVRHGRCIVAVPSTHRIGSLGSGLLSRIVGGADGRVSVERVEPFSRDDFLGGMGRDAATCGSGRRRALVFIHGYRVSFEDAARRAAQIGFDLGLGGATAFFSWPSQGRFRGYFADGDTIAASAPAITDFLVDVATLPEIDQVDVIAHSMGNRGLLSAVCRMAADAERLSGRRFGQFVLAAADVDVQVFRNDAGAYAALGERTTLYVSRRVMALRASTRISRFPRAGLHPPVTVVGGIDTVDVGPIDIERLGHGYVGNHRGVLADVHELLERGTPHAGRFGLEAREEAGARYWRFKA